MHTYSTARIGSALVLLALVGGCNGTGLLDAETPDIIDPSAVANATGAIALRNGAIGLFAQAYTGGGAAALVTYSGTLADEFRQSSTTVASAAPFLVDIRQIDDANTLVANISRPVHDARVTALQAAASLRAYAATPSARIGEMYAVAGFAETLLAETFCSGMPVGTINGGNVLVTAPLSTREILEMAVSHFDSTLSLAGDSVRVANLGRVGRARALLALGRYAEAAATVVAVPTSFVASTEHSDATARQRNGVYVAHVESRGFTIANREGGNGLDFVTSNDARIQPKLIGTGTDASTPVYAPTRLAARTTSMPFASGIEARLIEAEAQLKVGQAGSFLATLNALRTGAITPALPALVDPGTQVSREDLLFRERAFWLFGTAHRLGDLRRLTTQYARTASDVYPNGAYSVNVAYGAALALPVPAIDRGSAPIQSCNQ